MNRYTKQNKYAWTAVGVLIGASAYLLLSRHRASKRLCELCGEHAQRAENTGRDRHGGMSGCGMPDGGAAQDADGGAVGLNAAKKIISINRNATRRSCMPAPCALKMVERG